MFAVGIFHVLKRKDDRGKDRHPKG
jgi:hypothetical protein